MGLLKKFYIMHSLFFLPPPVRRHRAVRNIIISILCELQITLRTQTHTHTHIHNLSHLILQFRRENEVCDASTSKWCQPPPLLLINDMIIVSQYKHFGWHHYFLLFKWIAAAFVRSFVLLHWLLAWALSVLVCFFVAFVGSFVYILFKWTMYVVTWNNDAIKHQSLQIYLSFSVSLSLPNSAYLTSVFSVFSLHGIEEKLCSVVAHDTLS